VVDSNFESVKLYCPESDAAQNAVGENAMLKFMLSRLGWFSSLRKRCSVRLSIMWPSASRRRSLPKFSFSKPEASCKSQL